MSRRTRRPYYRREYERVDSDPTIADSEPLTMASSDDGQKQTLLTPGSNRAAFDPAEMEESAQSTSAMEKQDSYELEQYEMDDHIGDIPLSFNRRHRREGLFSSTGSRPDESWETSELLASNHTGKSDEFITSDDQGKEDENEETGMRKYAKLILPHVGLVFLTCAYTLIGASVFYSFENPNEHSTKRQQASFNSFFFLSFFVNCHNLLSFQLNLIYLRQEQFVTSMLELAAVNETNRDVWSEIARMHMHNMSDHLFVAFEKYFLTSNEVKRNTTIEVWSFSTAIFFAVTVVTTIGYGNPVPITRAGRLACILFSLFGIPLTLVTIADLGKFLSEHLIWLYGNYRKIKHYLCRRVENRKEKREHVCEQCQSRGISPHMLPVEEQKIPAMLVLSILMLYTALGGVLMSHLEPWSFFTSFYWSFITMTTVGFGDLMPRRDEYMYLILSYIILGLAITTMCIDLVGVQYIRKIHYFGRKIQDARSALAVVGGKNLRLGKPSGMAIFIIKVNEENGNPTEAEDCQLGLSKSQLFVDSFSLVKLSWNFHKPNTNLLDWIGMFETEEKNPLHYLEYKSNGVCGAPKGHVDWRISGDHIRGSDMRRNISFRYYDGMTGNLRAESPALLVYTDAQLIIDSISCDNVPKNKNASFFAKVHCGELHQYKTPVSPLCSWSNLGFVFKADRSREIQLVVKEKAWRRDHVVGEANVPIADLIHQRNQEFAFVLRPSKSSLNHFDYQIHISCHFIPEYRQPIEETMNNLQLSQPLVEQQTETPKSVMSGSTSDSSAISSSIMSDRASSSSISSSNLPPGWEARVDSKGRLLYLDHINKTTSWKPPTILEPESDDQSDLIFNSNIRYHNSRRTVTINPSARVDKNSNLYSRPVIFLCQYNFVNLLHDNPEALNLYNDSVYLKHIIHKIRKDPNVFQKFSKNKELVDFLNSFADKTQPLPNGWQVARRQNMEQRLYIDHNSRQITLIDPRLPVESRSRTRSAPPSRRQQDTNGNYALDIIEKSDEIARLVKMRLPEIAPRVCHKLEVIKHDGVNALRRYANDIDLITAISFLDVKTSIPKTEFEEKVHYFYQSLHRAGYGQGPGKIRFRLRRSNLLTDAFEKMLSVDPMHLRKYHMTVTFDEEDGLDYGGPSRELFFLLSRELFNPYYGLFENSNDNYTAQLSPMSRFVENNCQWMELCGRVLGLALIHRCLVDTFFTRPFYKMLLGEPYKLEDLQFMDMQYYNSLLWIRNNKVTPDLELTFNTSEEVAGEIVEQELLPGGKQMKVTESNKEEFISLMIRWRVEKNAENQNKALLRGLYSIIDREYLRVFDAKQLELVLSGTVEINIEDWRENTEYKGGYYEGHIVIRWFWDTVYSLSNADRLKLLQFVTGTSSVPFEGFKALRGSNGLKKFTIEKYGTEYSLPRAHTCFNRLDLPPYPTQKILLSKLLTAINESSTYAIE